MKIGILGGTFDPVHNGHLLLARKAKDQFQLGKILFVPAYISPHKVSDDLVTEASHRREMTRLAIQEEPGFALCTVELDRGGISYTIETLRMLKKEHPADEFFLILGEDNFKELENWRESQKIRQLAYILVARRGVGQPEKPVSKRVSWIDMPFCPYAASEIRRRIRDGKSVQGMLPLGAEKYICSKKLYRSL